MPRAGHRQLLPWRSVFHVPAEDESGQPVRRFLSLSRSSGRTRQWACGPSRSSKLRVQPRAAPGAGLAATSSDLFPLLLAHSFRGKRALTYAAYQADELDPGLPPLLGLDISGLGRDYAVEQDIRLDPHQHGHWKRNWGALRFYPSNTFREAAAMVAPMPPREQAEAGRWPRRFTDAARKVRVPVRLTFAECELSWRHDEDTVADLTAPFGAAPSVRVDRRPGAGHNISLGWAARTHHLRAFACFEDCLARRTADAGASVTT